MQIDMYGYLCNSCVVFQSWIPAVRQRYVQDEWWRAKVLPTVHDRLLLAATRGPGQPPSSPDGRAESGRQRWQLPLRQHLRALS